MSHFSIAKPDTETISWKSLQQKNILLSILLSELRESNAIINWLDAFWASNTSFPQKKCTYVHK